MLFNPAYTPALLWLVLIGSVIPQARPIRLDSSDWWSSTRTEELTDPETSPITVQHREPAETNFKIAGVTLGTPWDFSEIRSKFGEGTEIERGDAASGRHQMCYLSPSGNVHLIFEFGEVNSALYLFADGPKWNGSEFCAVSPTISGNDVSTGSGLRLGMTPMEVENILGNPSIATPQKVVYHFSFRKKTMPEALAQLRKDNPNMSDAEFAENFKYVDVEDYIEARFAAEKLNYLAISKSETY